MRNHSDARDRSVDEPLFGGIHSRYEEAVDEITSGYGAVKTGVDTLMRELIGDTAVTKVETKIDRLKSIRSLEKEITDRIAALRKLSLRARRARHTGD